MTDKPAFTPGPWEFGPNDDGRKVIFINRGIGNHVAYLSNGGVDEEQEEANGHLIAAAPDLYGALTALAKAVATTEAAGALLNHAPAAWANVGDALAATEAALAKARGEVGAEAPSHGQHGTGETQLAEQARAQPNSNPEGFQ